MMKHEKRPAAAGPEVTHSMRVRSIGIALAMVVGFGIVVSSLVHYQIVDPGPYREKAEAQQLKDTVVEPQRGTIYDANLNILAQSGTVWTVVADPASMATQGTNVNMVAQKLADILGLDAEDVLQKLLQTDSSYQVLKKKVEKPVADEISQWMTEYNDSEAGKLSPIAGITMEEDSKRYYPYGSLASSVLGFSGTDGNGLAGLELYYDDALTGVPGRIQTAKNALGYAMEGDYQAEYDPQDGYSLVLTLDQTIQASLEKYLANAIADYNVANRGTGIVMNVKTGAILAMATLPDYDSNDPYTLYDTALTDQINAIADESERKTALTAARQAMWRNKAVQDIYEPGSVFKVVTASAALDSGAATLDTQFSCSGRIHIVNDIYMRCAHEEGHGTLDFYGGLNNSCNPYFIQLGWLMGKDIFCHYVQAFGFYEKTGIDLPNEAQSNLYHADQMNITELSSSSFGQSSQVTPIALITAVAAAVNGGKLVQPYLVQQVLDADGNIVSSTQPTVKRQVISEDTSKTIASLLERSVAEGQNHSAYVAGYRVGGKSGTSQKQTVTVGNEDDTLRIASFCGFAPADDPEIACLIVLDEPHDSYNSFGGRLCGPVVSSIFSEILPYLGFEPQYTEAELANAEVTVPNAETLTVLDANMALNKLGLNSKQVGSGTTVTYQYPAAGTQLARQSTVILYTDEGSEGSTVTVPDVTGKTVKLAEEILKASGLNLKQSGVTDTDAAASVVAMSQDVAAGTQAPMGTVVTVTFHDQNVRD